MRLLQILAVLSGAVATMLLVASAHPLRDRVGEDNIWYVILGATVQIGCAVAALVVAWGSAGRIALIAGSMIVLGSAAFSGVLFAIVAFDVTSANILAPVGGLIAFVGWIALAFADRARI